MPERRKPDFSLELALWNEGFRRVAGVDEAGRGPLAGPVVAAAVILPPAWPDEVPLDDSKRMTPAAREVAFAEIRRRAVAWRVAVVPHTEIDRINILRATLAGMARAVAGLKAGVDCVLVDGNQAPPVAVPCRTVVGGDGKSLSVAAASVLAKVVRDRLMCVYDRRYPGWGFAGHKGYPTAAHRDAVLRLGLSPIHRRSFGGYAEAAMERTKDDGAASPAVTGQHGAASPAATGQHGAASPAATGQHGASAWPDAAEIENAGAMRRTPSPEGSVRTRQPDFWNGMAARSASATGAARKARST